MDRTVLPRYVGNVLLIAGYFVLLHVNLVAGVYIRIVANLLVFPWAIKHKVWDLLFVLTFLIAIEVSKLLTL